MASVQETSRAASKVNQDYALRVVRAISYLDKWFPFDTYR